ncbi:MAG: nucleoside triphosphate pyrophosphohydrolase [Gammaproteobacteria bacterium]|nr:nucleoside triphosphate pyrophosphohydrolase [Gammaproteobacteria bacterium]
MANSIEPLLRLMAQLRHSRHGCAWDRAQTMASLTPHTLEEAHEVVDCIEREAWDELPDELGDLLFQVVFYAQLAAEAQRFDFTEVVQRVVAKLTRRHPHIFGDAAPLEPAAQRQRWEELKAAERRMGGAPRGELAGIPRAMPALARAAKLQGRAAHVGFDWPATGPVLEKLDEELAELQAARSAGDALAVAAEMGDVLFTCVNLARHLGVDAERALRLANTRFEQRFEQMEARAQDAGQSLEGLDAGAWESLWKQAKAALG